MSEVPNDLKYSDSHEWLKPEGEIVRVGITDYAQSELTDIVFVELPEVGKEIEKGDELCVVESVKSVTEIYSPISGKIVNVNKQLEETPETINESPYEEGWLVEIEVKDKAEVDKLLSADDYKKLI